MTEQNPLLIELTRIYGGEYCFDPSTNRLTGYLETESLYYSGVSLVGIVDLKALVRAIKEKVAADLDGGKGESK